jgi:hypothetical protein
MDIGQKKLSQVYKYFLNQSGTNAITLGDGSAVNWNVGGVVALTGNQGINGEKYFNNTITAPNIYINNPVSDSSLEIGGAGNVYIDLKKPNTDDFNLRIATDGSAGILNAQTGPLVFQTNNGNARLNITQAGNVGIGTTNPTCKLHIIRTGGQNSDGEVSYSDGTQWTRLNSNTTTNAYNSLVQAGDHSIIWGNSASAPELGSMVIGPWSNSAKGLRITNSGNVGIGTSSPIHKLTVNGEITSTALEIGNIRMIGGNYGAFFRNDGDAFYLLSTSGGHQYEGWNTNRPFVYNLSDGRVYINSITALLNGNIGIGTANPTSKLHVVGNSYTNGTLSADSASFGLTSLNRTDISNEGGQLDFKRANDNVSLWHIDVYGSTDDADLRVFANTGPTAIRATTLGQVAFSYLDQSVVTNFNIELNKYAVRRATCSAAAHTITTTVPIAGTRATLILVGYATTSVITFSTGFKTSATLSVTNTKTFVMEFVSDGTNMLEVSRSLGFTS